MGHWQQVEIGNKTADWIVPSQPSPQGYTVLFLHGHGEITLRDNEQYTSHLERLGLRCLCPHGKRSWWGEQICTEFDPLVSPANYLRGPVLDWLAAQGVSPPAIGLVGVSMGGQGALKLAYKEPNRFPVVAALSPAIDFYVWHGRGYPLDDLYESAEEARQDSATILIHPLNWPRHQLFVCDPSDREWFEGAERLASKLSSSGIPFEHDLKTRAGGHTWEYFNHQSDVVLQFVADRLDVEHKRLPTLPPSVRIEKQA